jgi:peptide/nickel transport system substrate-binding protein
LTGGINNLEFPNYLIKMEEKEMLRGKWRLIAVIMITGLIAISFGCSAPTTTANPTPAAPTTAAVPKSTLAPSTVAGSAAPKYGGVLKILKKSGMTNFGLPPTTPSDQTYGRPAVETLVTVDSQGKGDILPLLATSWKYSPDYKSITFNLRQGVKFHDGTDFNAAAAKYCMDLVRTSPQGVLKNLASVDIVDDYTIRLNLSSYDATLFLNLATARCSGMMSPKALQAMSKDEAMIHPVGTGPFKFVSCQRDVSVKFTKFDGYWQKGKPYLDGMEFACMADTLTRSVSLKSGDGDILGDSPETKDAAELQASGKYKIILAPSSVYGLIGDSAHSDSPYSNIKVRQAAAYAIDSKAITKALGYGFYQDSNQFATPDGPFYNSTVVGYPFNPAKAKQLLSEAGYANGFKTTLVFSPGGVLDQMFTAVQAYFKDVGIEASVKSIDMTAFNALRMNGWTNSLLWFPPKVSTLDGDPGSTLRTNLSSASTMYDPKSVYIPSDYDSKLALANGERDVAKRAAMFQELNKMIIDQYCLASTVYISTSIYVYSSAVRDCDFAAYSGAAAWSPENIWLSK